MNLARCLMVPFVCFSAALTGCGSSQKVDTTQPEDINALAHVPGAKIYQEWQEVWSIEVRGKDVQSRKVGYLERQFSDEDSEGRYFVRDLAWDIRGFLLPEGKAFIYEPRSLDKVVSRDLGNTGFENGVKKILRVTGGIELRTPARAVTPKPETTPKPEAAGSEK
ncbi:MAG TPA: hypothetical protein VFD71_18985 [Planctomycetota bacterium]|nr:hypothetical protein [Planctomycetota bacterium]